MKIGNSEVYGIIYKIKNTINNKIYIGQTINGFNTRYSYDGIGIERVYNYHKYNKKNNRSYNSHLLNSINKYGFESFEVNKVIDYAFSETELNIKEKTWIRFYNAYNNGYNNTEGGDNGRLSEETKRKISQTRIEKGLGIGVNNPMYGKSGKLSPNWGRKHSEETKRKIREKGLRRVYTKEFGDKISKTRIDRCIGKGGDNNHSRKVICITTGEVFDCISDASIKYFGKPKSRIGNCCKGKSKYSGKLEDGTKLIWKYYNEYIKELKESA